MQIAHADTFRGEVTSPEFRGGGKEFRTLLKGRDGDRGNYRMVYARQTGAVSGPRHRHNFDQIRLCLEGRVNFGPDRWIDPGEVAYFPEGASYGPEESDVARLALTIQFGGPSGLGFVSETQQLAAMAELKMSGRFENGVYRREGDLPEGTKRNQDAFEAIWEHVNGCRISYPQRRYDEPILMRPQNFCWRPVMGEAGVAERRLGTYSERNVSIAMRHLEPGARTSFAARGGALLGFMMSGSAEFSGQALRPHSAFELAAGETGRLAAESVAEIFLLGLPEFSE
jgi:quercetin dioxygenase-like cupin family protein